MSKTINAESELMTASEAEKLTGISQQEVSRWLGRSWMPR